MVLNQGKCHFMSLGKNTENQTFVYKNKIKKTNEEQKVFGIIIDDKLTFKSRVKNFSKKTSQKIWALASLSRYLDDTQKGSIFGSVIRSQLRYCPTVWITNNMIDKLHERALRIVLNNQTINFETLLAESSDICNHHRNIQKLMTERHIKYKKTLLFQ